MEIYYVGEEIFQINIKILEKQIPVENMAEDLDIIEGMQYEEIHQSTMVEIHSDLVT